MMSERTAATFGMKTVKRTSKKASQIGMKSMILLSKKGKNAKDNKAQIAEIIHRFRKAKYVKANGKTAPVQLPFI